MFKRLRNRTKKQKTLRWIQISCVITLLLGFTLYYMPKNLVEYWGLDEKKDQIESVTVSQFSSREDTLKEITDPHEIENLFHVMAATQCSHDNKYSLGEQENGYELSIYFDDGTDWFALVYTDRLLFITPKKKTIWLTEPGELRSYIESLL